MPVDVTYKANRTWRVVYPHPIETVVRVKVLATIFVETSAAHCDDEKVYDERGKVERNGARLVGEGTRC